MKVNTKSTTDWVQKIDNVIDEFQKNKDELIPILIKISSELGHISPEAIEQISNRMHLPKSKIHSVASFYQLILTKETGRHVIKFCESAPCHVAGGREVWKAIQEELKIKPGETSADSKWTLITTSCLGICAVGPVMMIDDDIYGNLRPDQISSIFGKYE